MLVVLFGILFFAMFTTPLVERSGEVTDMWEDDGFYKLEIDNSFTERVDDFTYHNAVVGGTYSWKEPQQSTSLAIYTMMPIALVSVCLIAIVAGD